MALAPATGPAAPFVEAGAMAFQALSPLVSVFHIRAGANEADKIVPTQNEIHQGLASVDQLLATSTSIPQLQGAIRTVEGWGADFMAFITSSAFTDGRASEQAANTLMPLINGTGGYEWPEMQGHWVTADKWGNPTNGGRIGSLSRKIQSLGGVAVPAQITQGGGGMYPTLNYQTPGGSYIPQGGYIPPTGPLSQIQPAGSYPSSVGGDSAGALPLLALGGLLLFGLRRR